MNVLYVSYDGALDPLGRSQVVPYLEGLSRRGHRFQLLSFEKPWRWRQDAERSAMAERLSRADISWHPLRYHKRLSAAATAFDLLRGLGLARRLVARRHVELVHARSYPASVIASGLYRRTGVPYIFDMRGLYADERVDGGLWPAQSHLYRAAKALERRFLNEASAVVTLTEASVTTVETLMRRAGGQGILEVIPTCVDLDRFRPTPNRAPSAFTLSYFGSVGTWYLLDHMLAFGRIVLSSVVGARLLYLVNGDPGTTLASALNAGIPEDRITVRSVSHEQVPDVLAAASATYGFVRPAPSMIAMAATKVSESLALGLPVAVNRGVGDAATIVEHDGVGVVVDPYAPETFAGAAWELHRLAGLDAVRAACRRTAERRFDLAGAVARYDGLYHQVAEGRRDDRSGI